MTKIPLLFDRNASMKSVVEYFFRNEKGLLELLESNLSFSLICEKCFIDKDCNGPFVDMIIRNLPHLLSNSPLFRKHVVVSAFCHGIYTKIIYLFSHTFLTLANKNQRDTMIQICNENAGLLPSQSNRDLIRNMYTFATYSERQCMRKKFGEDYFLATIYNVEFRQPPAWGNSYIIFFKFILRNI